MEPFCCRIQIKKKKDKSKTNQHLKQEKSHGQTKTAVKPKNF